MNGPNINLKRVILAVVGLFFLSVFKAGFAADAPKTKPVMEGKKKTDRSVVLNYVVDAPPEKVFKLWSTVEGTRKFFGADAVIELKPGGAYEIYFFPRTNPKSDINSTKGAILMWMEKGKKLAFEWTMPPFAGELNVKPLPTWVEVSFRPLKNNRDKTSIRVAHHGFKRGGKWDKCYEFFVRSWARILYSLDLCCSGMTLEWPFLEYQVKK